MEKIKVNMSPNPLDVQTIHASQNDGEARQWEFELHNNGELIDTSDVKEQLVFKAYKGGTEQLLPENTLTPTTTPILADIQYPDGLRTDQYFTYRETPTTVSNKARIKTIKGNTLNWNQLVPISTRATTTTNGITFTNNDDGSAKASGTASATAIFNFANANAINIKSGHKYLLKGCPSGGGDSTYQMSLRASNGITIIGNDVGNGILFTASNDYTNCALYLRVASGATINETYIPQLFDLTQMGLNISNPSDFTSLFPLSYYSYNQGSLLSFNGNGIKTVGKNLNPWTGVDYIASTSRTVFLKKGNYVLSTDNGNNFEGSTQIYFCLADSNGNNITSDGITSGYLSLNDSGTYYYGGYGRNNIPFTLNFDAFASFGFNNQRPANINEIQLEFGSSASSYESYQESTLSLPISTYFPTGMKSAGSVYDELTPRKAITRIGELNIGSSTTISTWESSDGWTANIELNGYKPNGAIKSDKFEYIGSFNGASSFATSAKAKGGYCLGIWENSNRIYFYSSSATTSNDLINAIRGTNLYYELATPIETPITTASLVTENTEIPLSNNDGVLIGKCTEELSAEPGFHDAKIKLSDGDGECYSNKLQLHVERSPQ